MNNSIRVPEDKDFVCAFVTSPDSFYEAIESYRNYVDPVGEIEFHRVLIFMLYAILEVGGAEVSINDEVQKCIEHIINEKNIIRKNNACNNS
ncbi:hypothetical protein LU030_004267 [Salmonella enterica]|jgi:mannosyltransferase OCH1-like enzyme|uniref:Uncharacterized protein n=4 Tax=Salmonella enterica TaxID=28901 RepID=A0A607PH46_SALET|nr:MULTISPECIES: hypothetical protein [Enterobacteriaceae]EAA6712823.1 hypothetical protein [Salmonella enterica subsp. enterica serovar Arechavaleta]EAC0927324.1 hypothetical protein [Salmonella enterica subsp. enterica serovar Lisboa]EBF0116146.1 hypothetical protein [Salmonella enterica subsp. enterica]EDD5585814.1 hypothetical protein [Salmonella enterica subsp. enterica serovar Enteritidis]EDK0621068.1 hypothetical protein [Salmonella bongori]EFG4928911.1 hypothetical protein [Escherichi